MELIQFEDFAKVEIRMGTVLEAEVPEGSEKLIKYRVDFGEHGQKTIFSGIKAYITPGDLIGKQLPFRVNLAPRKMGNLGFSEGMLLAAAPETTEGHGCVLLVPQAAVPNGTQVI